MNNPVYIIESCINAGLFNFADWNPVNDIH